MRTLRNMSFNPRDFLIANKKKRLLNQFSLVNLSEHKLSHSTRRVRICMRSRHLLSHSTFNTRVECKYAREVGNDVFVVPVHAVQTPRPTLSQLRSIKICCTTFLNNMNSWSRGSKVVIGSVGCPAFWVFCLYCTIRDMSQHKWFIYQTLFNSPRKVRAYLKMNLRFFVFFCKEIEKEEFSPTRWAKACEGAEWTETENVQKNYTSVKFIGQSRGVRSWMKTWGWQLASGKDLYLQLTTSTKHNTCATVPGWKHNYSIPDQTCHNFRATKTVDRRFWTD